MQCHTVKITKVFNYLQFKNNSNNKDEIDQTNK